MLQLNSVHQSLKRETMGCSFFLCPILCLQFLFFISPSYCSSSNPLCSLDEASALLQFKSSFTLDSLASDWCVDLQSSYPKTDSWENGTDCCMWDGVTCDTLSGHVIGLDLSCSWLYGELHPNSTLFQLTHLQTLNLSFNFFNGSQISSKFGGFVSLTHLNLSYSVFIGEIPHEISYLSKLVSLDLSWNGYQWYNWYDDRSLTLQSSIWRNFIQNVTDLRELHLDSVNMSFIRSDSLSLLTNLSSSLVFLSLEGTELQGTLPNSIIHLPNLQHLSLSGNQNFSIQIPKSNWSTPLKYLQLFGFNCSQQSPNSIGYLRSLDFLYLESCAFQGPIPPSFSNLVQLTHLDLQGNNFNGEIPSSILFLQHLTSLDLSDNNLSGQIPSSLSNLQNLTYLSLSYNSFSGQIPSSISYLQHLTFLDLSENNLSGQIPSSLSNLQNLTYLCLSYNSFSGQIPSSISYLQHLIFLDLSTNNFGGQFPILLFSLTHIQYLRFSSNKVEGPIPKNISGLSNLMELDLANNSLNGTIPSWCFSLPSLKYLLLYNNKLTGHVGEFLSYSLEFVDLSNNLLQNSIPKSMFDLTNLTDLDLSSNNFSGVLDFQKFSKLQHLESLYLSKNIFLSFNFDSNINYTISNLQSLGLSFCNIHSIPKFLGRQQSLQNLDLSNNKIRGRVPDWLIDIGNSSLSSSDLSHNFLSSVKYNSRRGIRFLDLSFNLLEGDLPIPLYGVEFFSVSNNNLTGQISSKICNARSLIILNLSHNKLTGQIPQCLGSFSYLSVLDLQMNKLFGTIPGNISKANMFQTLKLNHNQLEGPLPRSLTRCKQLEVLDLGDNEIEDTFPNWLEPLEELQILILRANKFHGVIVHLKSKQSFPKLRIFDVSSNHFNGSLPATYIKEFKGMMGIDDRKIGLQYMRNKNYSSYNDSVLITVKGVFVELTRILVTYTTIDLSNNKFEGEIPDVIGELNSLKGLNLSHNRITGTIPPSLGNLKSLEWLDLSSNKLTGEIPKALTNLNFLSVLNLSQNQLVGTIPQEKQFGTFSNDSYKGNLGLCGFPLSKTCNNDQEQQPSSAMFHDEDEFGFGWKAVAVGYGCGFLFGVLMGYLVFSTGKPQWLVNLVEGGSKRRARITKSRVSPNHGRRD